MKICVAHGQMEPKELENRMLDFIRGDYDNVVGLPLSRLVRELNVVCSGHDYVLDVLGG